MVGMFEKYCHECANKYRQDLNFWKTAEYGKYDRSIELSKDVLFSVNGENIDSETTKSIRNFVESAFKHVHK